MFIGHFAVGFASKRLAPKTSAATLLLAPLFLDILWPIFIAAGIETVRIDPGNTAFTPLDLHDYPWSHSLLMAVVWSVALAAVFFAFARRGRDALVIAAGVFSHWILDFVTHRPDMPLYPGGTTQVGLGLWNSRPGTLLVESAMFVAGVWIYARTTRARDRVGAVGWWSFVALLVVLYVATAFGPPPPSVKAIVVMGFVAWIFFPWLAWADRHRALTA
jgi:membrane-bound metal-dependent hydrolase YbcI (DUF457 family)